MLIYITTHTYLIFLNTYLTLTLARLQAGPLLLSLLRDWRQVAGAEEVAGQGAGLARLEGGVPSLARLYSGHDTTITFLLHSLGLYDGTPPPYASAVIFELYQDQNKTFR